MIDTRLSGLDYLEKEIRQEVESINPDNMTAMEYALLADAYRFVLARIQVARLFDS